MFDEQTNVSHAELQNIDMGITTNIDIAITTMFYFLDNFNMLAAVN